MFQPEPPLGRNLGRVLILAGSDSGGGAGLQADVKTVTALGGHAATAVTAITVQNSRGVHRADALSPELVDAQARAVLDDLGADAIKTGMLPTPEIIERVAALLDEAGLPAVIDPVMTAKGGASLADDAAVTALKALLVPRATLLTPNTPEAEALTGLTVTDADSAREAGERLLRLGAKAVLMKGGHLPGESVVDQLITVDQAIAFEAPRQATRHSHGTGCTLASACAVGLAQGLDLEAAVRRAHAYLQGALAHAPGFGRGHGPLDHGWMLREQR
ncbi:MAG: bifunctional hydroxymethylpyrimidine kinase/phosphomethylpyrimidine kinase [Pseudomonadota bacterium]